MESEFAIAQIKDREIQDLPTMAYMIESMAKEGERLLREHPSYEVDILRNTIRSMRISAQQVIEKSQVCAKVVKGVYFDKSLAFIEANANGRVMPAESLEQLYNSMPQALSESLVLVVVKHSDLRADKPKVDEDE